MGWGQQLDLQREPGSGRWVLRRELPPGRFPFKFIVDGRWTCSADHPTFMVPHRSQAPAQPFSRTLKVCKSSLSLLWPALRSLLKAPLQPQGQREEHSHKLLAVAAGPDAHHTSVKEKISRVLRHSDVTRNAMWGVPEQDGETLNNYVEVPGESGDPGAVAARARLLSEEAPLTGAERARLEQRFGVCR